MTQKYRKGDIVSILAVVNTHYDTGLNNILDGQVSLSVTGSHAANLFLDPQLLTMVTPFFEAGERVRTKSSVEKKPVEGTVIANSEGSVWVKFDHGKHGTVPATDLVALPKGGIHVVAA